MEDNGGEKGEALLLKNCPFCNGPTRILRQAVKSDGSGEAVYQFIQPCQFHFAIVAKSEEEAIQKWNARPLTLG